MVPAAAIRNREVAAFADQARAFLLSHAWCETVTSLQLAWATAGILGVFLAEVVGSKPGVDQFLWVVVGDLPPAYLVRDDAPTWHEALRCYVTEMRKWVAAVRAGASTREVIPVNAPSTPEYANLLEARLKFVTEEILSTPPGVLASDT